ncbi:MAG TPA: dihydrofolate reductase family protein, partial [Chitinophagaceae bacterium]|nr:dihydrofolate reductase family protein [Chitinophagaceae bacterium]
FFYLPRIEAWKTFWAERRKFKPKLRAQVNMRKVILLAHISLDGFVAGSKGELDGFDAGEENLQFVSELTEEADAALFGRKSYELLNSFWPTAKDLANASKGQIAYSTWYCNAGKIVVSRTMANQHLANTLVVAENVPNEIANVKLQPGKNILIFGSPSVSQLLMQHKLIDSYWIFVNPVIFGDGIPLFKSFGKRMQFKLVTTKEFSNGEVAMNFIPDSYRD